MQYSAILRAQHAGPSISRLGLYLLPRSQHPQCSNWHSQNTLIRGLSTSLFRKRVVVASLQRFPGPSPPCISRTKRYSVVSGSNNKITGLYFAKIDPLYCDRRELNKSQIAEQFDLQYRDLRDIDLRSEAVTRILVRPATVLVQFFDLCVIIQADEAILIDRVHQDQNGNGKDEAEEGQGHPANTSLTQVFKDSLASITNTATEAAEANLSSQLPFEFHALEAAYVAVLSILQEELASAREEAENSARQLKLEPGHAAVGVDQLFERSQRLFKIEQKARLLRETTRQLLDTDEDLAALYVSDTVAGKPHTVSDHQEAEYMLEAYHKAADTLAESASSAVSAIQKKENNFRSALAVQRNQIMFLEARVAIHTLGLAAGTLIAGLFGMNLINYAEEAPWGFPVVTAACVMSSALLSLYGARRLRKITTLREIQQGYLRSPRHVHARRK